MRSQNTLWSNLLGVMLFTLVIIVVAGYARGTRIDDVVLVGTSVNRSTQEAILENSRTGEQVVASIGDMPFGLGPVIRIDGRSISIYSEDGDRTIALSGGSGRAMSGGSERGDVELAAVFLNELTHAGDLPKIPIRPHGSRCDFPPDLAVIFSLELSAAARRIGNVMNSVEEPNV